MCDQEQYIDCCEHGPQVATYVCQHIVETLKDGKARGFWSAECESGNKFPDSWCDSCEARVNAAGGWNDENEKQAGVTIICSLCYAKAKSFNEHN